MTKLDLYQMGINRMNWFCDFNGITPPAVFLHEGRPRGRWCAYYRNRQIHIWPVACSSLGTGGRSYSWPGYTVDRTPYGVILHELGHHVDAAHGPRGGTFGKFWMRLTGEPAITGYAPNPNEWFAEMFKVFVTNPDLLRLLRPKTYRLMCARWEPVERRPWEQVLGAAQRQVNAARNKIRQVTKTG